MEDISLDATYSEVSWDYCYGRYHIAEFYYLIDGSIPVFNYTSDDIAGIVEILQRFLDSKSKRIKYRRIGFMGGKRIYRRLVDHIIVEIQDREGGKQKWLVNSLGHGSQCSTANT